LEEEVTGVWPDAGPARPYQTGHQRVTAFLRVRRVAAASGKPGNERNRPPGGGGRVHEYPTRGPAGASAQAVISAPESER
jgi:hypothetical protein